MNLVVWQGDGVVEEAEEGSASEEEITRVRELLRPLRAPGIKLSDVVRFLTANGYRVVGDRRFDFRSGELYQDARTLATECFLAGADAASVSARHSNTNPLPDHPDWPTWEAAVRRRNATAKGARVLGVASVEALVNEIFSQRFPDDYQALEMKRKASPLTKLRRLMEHQGIPSDIDWMRILEDSLEPRRRIVHHKPGYVDEIDIDPTSVTPSEITDPAAILRFLSGIDAMFESVFESFGFDVPVTHLSPHHPFAL